MKQREGQARLGENCGGEAASLVAEIDLGSHIINSQANALEKQAQQVSPPGFKLTAQTPL